MEIDLILALTLAGITLGLVEGIKPGPLLTMVIKETLSGGLRAGAWTAAAPIFTDGPLIIISLLAASWFATEPKALFAISIIGGLFLIKMGIDCFSIVPPEGDELLTDAKGAFQRGLLINLLNPNVYVFWFLIGGPLMASAAAEEPLAPVAYALSFLISIILVKIFIAYMFDKTRGNISIKMYKNTLSLCGVAMLIFAIVFIIQGIEIWANGF